MVTITTYDLQTNDSCMKDSCTKRRCFRGASIEFLDKASHMTAFSPHLPVTPAQLMRPGIG